MQDDDEVEMEVFRSGDYGAKGSYSVADLQRMADDYRSDLLEAPLTFDHAQTGPAYGWVSRLRCEGDRLVAALKGVPDAVRDAVKSGSYKRRSVELFRKLPHTGRPYLRAVSLLGAATPEVKGLRDVCFAANNDALQMELDAEAAGPVDALEKAESPVEFSVPQASESPTMATMHAQLLESRLALMFSELRADGYCLADRDAQAIRTIVTGPRSEASTARFDDSAAGVTLDWLTGFLRQTLLRAPLGQAAAGSTAGGTKPQFSETPPRAAERTNPRSMALHMSALHIQSQSPEMEYRDALRQASRLI